MPTLKIAAIGIVAALALLAGCGPASVVSPFAGVSDRATPMTLPPAPDLDASRPPTLVVYGDGEPVSVRPTSYCWGNGCADGASVAPSDLPYAVGAALPIGVGPDLPLYVEMRDLDRGCSTSDSTYLTTDHLGHALLEPVGHAGRYLVSVSVSRPGGGDAAYEFVWGTTTDGPPPPPRAEMGLLDAHAGDGHLMNDGLSVTVTGVPASSLTSMTVSVTAADGRRLTLPTPARSAGKDRAGCPPATVIYTGGASDAVLDLGPGPYTYGVTLTIDGKQYVGTGVWPRDEDSTDLPQVPLTFDPPLPRQHA